MTLLDVQKLRVAFGDRAVVDGLDLQVEPGERVGLIGGSGAGKSQAAAAVLGVPAESARCSGSVRFAGRELLGAPPRELSDVRGPGLALIGQDALTALHPLVRVGRQLTLPLRRHRGLSRAAAGAQASGLLKAVGLPERALRAYPGELSGGQRQRALIAMALACRPRLLVADEPTTALDLTVQAEILALLDRLLRVAGDDAPPPPALLLISHDLAVVARLCTRIVVLHAGRVVESGTVSDVLTAPQHPHTRELVAAARASAWSEAIA